MSSAANSTVAPLFESLKLGPITLPNKIVMASMTRSRSVPTDVPNDLNVEYYVQRARGGAGLIVAEAALISSQKTDYHNPPGLWKAEHVVGWKKVIDAVHANGSYIYAQLWHLGRLAYPVDGNPPVVGPSAIAARGKSMHAPGNLDYVTPTTLEDPQTIVEEYRKAAKLALEAGFDGIELHAASGYLVHQFIDSSSNARTDAWGGSPEKRARFPLEILNACLEVFGKGRVGIKLAPSGGFNDMGMPLDETLETYGYLLTQIDKLGLAYICFQRHLTFLDVKRDGKIRGTPHDYIASYRSIVKDTPFILNGGLTAEEAAPLIASSQIAAAAFGSQWIAHPDYAKRVQHGKALDGKLDFKTLYGGGPALSIDELRKGYTDYPEAVY